MATNENLIPIPGRLHSVASDEIVSGADEIYDDKLSDNLENLNTGFTNDINTIYNTIGDNNEKGAIMEQLNTIDGRLDTIDGEISALNSIPIEVVPLNSAGTAPNVNSPEENTLYRAYNSDNTLYSDWMYQDGSWVMITQLLEPTSLEKLVGYYTCNTAANTPGKEVTTENSGYVLPANGGAMKIKMTKANTADNATLKIGSETAKPLWYNDERASSSNTWEEGEVISVYYDGENYKASNAMGGGSAVGKKKLNGISNYYIDLSGGVGTTLPTRLQGSAFNYIIYPVKEGDVISITGRGRGSKAHTWGMIDSEDKIVKESGEDVSLLDNYVLVIPEGVDKIVLNNCVSGDNSYPDYEWYYAKKDSVGAHEMLTEVYLYKDVRTLGVGLNYEKGEAVKTTNKQLLKLSKDIKTMSLTKEVAEGDLRTYSGATYQAQSAVGVYSDETEYNSGDYAIVDGVVKVYDGSDWNDVNISVYAASSVWSNDSINEAWLISNVAEQNSVPKLYSGIGYNIDGTMNQKAIADEILYEDPSNKRYDTIRNYFINGSGLYTNSTTSYTARCGILTVTPGEKCIIKANPDKDSVYAFLKSNPETVQSNTQADFVDNYETRYVIKAGETGIFVVPEGCSYLYIQRQFGTNIYTPEYIRKMVNIEDKVSGYDVPLNTAGVKKQIINAPSLTWSAVSTSSSTYYTSRVEPISQYKGKVLVITKNQDYTSLVALLKDNSNNVGEVPNFSRAERLVRLDGSRNESTTVKFLLTEDDKYLYMQVRSTNNNVIVPSFKIEEVPNIEDTLIPVENSSLTLDRTDYNLNVYNAETNPTGIVVESLCILSSSGAWSTTTSNARGFFLDVSTHKGGYLFVSNTNAECYFAFLKDNNNSDTNGAIPNYATGSERTIVPVGTKTRYNIPSDANLVFFGYRNSSSDPLFPMGVFAIGKDEVAIGESASSLDTVHTILTKKAAQLLDLKWTAKANISTTSSSSNTPYVTAGEQTGLLYSSVQEYDRSIGQDVSVKTFMTAVNNPYSLLYTENNVKNISEYGFVYRASISTTHAFFGTVCSRFACYVSGMEEWSTSFFAWLYKQGYLTKIQDQSAQGVEIGDFVWIPGHVQVITNLVKRNGSTVSVTITEAAQPVVRLVTRTATGFNNYLKATSGSGNNNGPGFIYRNNEIYKNVVYEPSPFIAVGNEVLSDEYQYNNDICTYAGDYAAFRLKKENDTRADSNVWLNYNLGDEPSYEWTAIKLYKEVYSDRNVLSLDEIATYNDVDFTEHRYQIPAANIAAVGKYRARLTDGTTNSDYTYFEIIETEVTFTKEGHVITVNFSSANGTPIKVVICSIEGVQKCVRMLSVEERINGTVTFNYKNLIDAQSREATGSNCYLKVFFKGEYGRVTNQPINILA